ncbi:MAG: hypothetical protein O3C04_04070 [Crenarchaeota archaeon]|nr:hypothetical protein [Thermoproteota archaeon]MDA1124806.1 hypothetical protein [Thermoproteota archaeon]
MSVWIGGIFLKEEGGYEIVLRSLAHYKKRLRTIGESPELKEAAAMFAPILQSQAQKRFPMVVEAEKKIKQILQNSIPLQSLEQDLEILEKALECRQADIEKAQDTGKDYFMKLLGDLQEATKDLSQIKNALVKIKQYSD